MSQVLKSSTVMGRSRILRKRLKEAARLNTRKTDGRYCGVQ